MNTQKITQDRMLAAGVSLEEARWYLAVGRPRGFSKPGDPERAMQVISKLLTLKH